MRAIDYARIAAGDLSRQPLRSALTIAALSISTVILIVMVALSIGGRQAIASQYGDGRELTTITVTETQAGAGLSVFGAVQHVGGDSTTLTDKTAADLAAIPHVTAAVPRAYIWELHDFAVAGSDQRFVAQAQGVPGDDRVPLAAGRYFASNDETGVVIIGLGYAKELGFANTPEKLVGKKISITTQPGYRGAGAEIPAADASPEQLSAFGKTPTVLTATVVGVTDTGTDQNSLLIPLGWAHQIRTARSVDSSVDQLARDGYTSIKLTVDSSAHMDSVARAVSDRGFGQFSAKAQIEQIERLTAVLWVVLGTVALIAALAAALGITNTMLMAVAEQRYIIGVWRAVGATRGTVVRLFLLQAALLGLVGGGIGSGVAFAASYLINAYADTLLRSNGLSVTNIVDVSPGLIVAAVVFTTLFGMAAGLYPARRAARQDPSEALRSAQ